MQRIVRDRVISLAKIWTKKGIRKGDSGDREGWGFRSEIGTGTNLEDIGFLGT